MEHGEQIVRELQGIRGELDDIKGSIEGLYVDFPDKSLAQSAPTRHALHNRPPSRPALC